MSHTDQIAEAHAQLLDAGMPAEQADAMQRVLGNCMATYHHRGQYIITPEEQPELNDVEFPPTLGGRHIGFAGIVVDAPFGKIVQGPPIRLKGEGAGIFNGWVWIRDGAIKTIYIGGPGEPGQTGPAGDAGEVYVYNTTSGGYDTLTTVIQGTAKKSALWYMSSNNTSVSNSYSTLTIDAEEWNDDGDLYSNSSGVVTVGTAGKYVIEYSLDWKRNASATSELIETICTKDGTSIEILASGYRSSDANYITIKYGYSFMFNASAGSTFEVRCKNSDSLSPTIYGGSGAMTTSLGIRQL